MELCRGVTHIGNTAVWKTLKVTELDYKRFENPTTLRIQAPRPYKMKNLNLRHKKELSKSVTMKEKKKRLATQHAHIEQAKTLIVELVEPITKYMNPQECCKVCFSLNQQD